jgi:hypothetical protein
MGKGSERAIRFERRGNERGAPGLGRLQLATSLGAGRPFNGNGFELLQRNGNRI